jgi:DNA primase
MTNFHEELAGFCNDLLINYPGAKSYRDYVFNRLSISNIIKYNIGYFPNNNEINILLDKFDEQSLIDNKILYKPRYDNDVSDMSYYDKSSLFFTDHRLIIPFYNTYSKILAFAGRTILSEKDRQDLGISKYKNEIFNKSDYLFNLDKAIDDIKINNNIIIVEGQFDCISCVENGINNVVAIGSSNLSTKQFALILRYTNNILLILDNDDSGKKGSNLILNKYSKYANIKIINLPNSYKDVDDFLKDNSASDFQMFVDID